MWTSFSRIPIVGLVEAQIESIDSDKELSKMNRRCLESM